MKNEVMTKLYHRKFQFLTEDLYNANGESFELIHPETIPNILYHRSPSENRESILRYGLVASIGEEYEDWWNYAGPNDEVPDGELPEAVFLSSTDTFYDDEDDYDLWAVNTKNLNIKNLYIDPDKSCARRHGSFCYLGDIPTTALRLVVDGDVMVESLTRRVYEDVRKWLSSHRRRAKC